MSKNNVCPVIVRMEPLLKARLEAFCAAKRMSQNEAMIKAIEAFMPLETIPPPETRLALSGDCLDPDSPRYVADRVMEDAMDRQVEGLPV